MINNEIKFKTNIIFDADKHRYTLNGKELISATQLMKKHKLAPDYTSVDSETLTSASNYGSFVHEELEKFIKNDEISFTSEVDNFNFWLKKNKLFDKIRASELMVNNDHFAGCIDLILGDDENLIIADFKTTSVVHKDAVSWQLSIYRNLLGLDIKKGLCLHVKGQLFEALEIPLKPVEEVEKLFDAELKGELYKTSDLIELSNIEALTTLQMQLMAMEETRKKIEARMEAFKEYAMQEMEARGLLTYKVEYNGIELSLTRILEGKRESVDTKKLQAENPEIYEQYKKTTPTKSYVKVSCKPIE